MSIRALGEMFHGTDEASVDSVLRGQKADRRGTQVYGPGFYTTADRELASIHARDRSRFSHTPPAVLAGEVTATNPVHIDADDLAALGRKWREQNPRIAQTSWADASDNDLGNIALRQAGHDFMTVQHGNQETGVILRPKKFDVLEISDPVN